MNYVQQSQAAGRELLPDLVRSFAILGIVVVNVMAFAYPFELGYGAEGLATSADRASWFGVNAIATAKSYSLFSLMFGVGLYYQMQSATRAGADLGNRYLRRMIGLAVLGLLHAYVAFMGDILLAYALLGGILFSMRDKSVASLRKWGIWLLGMQIVLLVLVAGMMQLFVTFAPEEFAELVTFMEDEGAKTAELFATGTFFEVAAVRLVLFSEAFIGILFFQGLGVFAYMVWGLAFAKSGMIADSSHPGWAKARKVALPIGLLVSAAGAWLVARPGIMLDPSAMWGSSLLMLGAPLSTLGYMGLIAKWAAARPGALKTFMARGGTATLTAYLLQSLLLSLVFSGYGLGLYAQLGAFACTMIALGVGVFTLAFTSLWRTRFLRGPMEWLLRRWTYLGDNRAGARPAASP